MKLRRGLKAKAPFLLLVIGCLLACFGCGNSSASNTAKTASATTTGSSSIGEPVAINSNPAISTGATSNPSQAPQTYLLRLNPSQGDHYTLVMRSDSTMLGGMPGAGSRTVLVVDYSYPAVAANQITQNTRIKKYETTMLGGLLTPKLQALMQAYVKDMTQSLMDKTYGPMKKVTVTKILDRQGDATNTPSTEGSEASDISEFYTDSLKYGFPRRPVKIGDTWKALYGAIDQAATYRLLGVKTVNGRHVAIVKVDSELNDSGLRQKSIGILKFDLATGILNSGKMSDLMTIKQGTVKNTITIQRS